MIWMNFEIIKTSLELKETLKGFHLKKILEAERGDKPAPVPDGPGADRRTRLALTRAVAKATSRARPLTGRVRPDGTQGKQEFSSFVFHIIFLVKSNHFPPQI